jgi:hypothetical protein
VFWCGIQVLRVTDALPWEAYWLIFNFSLISINAVITISLQGTNLFRALGNTDSAQIALICVIFLGFGFGATGVFPSSWVRLRIHHNSNHLVTLKEP